MTTKPRVTVCASFHRDMKGLAQAIESLKRNGCEVLAPESIDFADLSLPVVKVRGEEHRTNREIEREHVRSIWASDFVWLHDPEGYVGLAGALEIGEADSRRIPIFALTKPTDETIREFVTVVRSIEHACSIVRRSLGSDDFE